MRKYAAVALLAAVALSGCSGDEAKEAAESYDFLATSVGLSERDAADVRNAICANDVVRAVNELRRGVSDEYRTASELQAIAAELVPLARDGYCG